MLKTALKLAACFTRAVLSSNSRAFQITGATLLAAGALAPQTASADTGNRLCAANGTIELAQAQLLVTEGTTLGNARITATYVDNDGSGTVTPGDTIQPRYADGFRRNQRLQDVTGESLGCRVTGEALRPVAVLPAALVDGDEIIRAPANGAPVRVDLLANTVGAVAPAGTDSRDVSVAGGTLRVDRNGIAIFTPGPDAGTGSVTYPVTDNAGRRDESTITITVTAPTPPQPQAVFVPQPQRVVDQTDDLITLPPKFELSGFGFGGPGDLGLSTRNTIAGPGLATVQARRGVVGATYADLGSGQNFAGIGGEWRFTDNLSFAGEFGRLDNGGEGADVTDTFTTLRRTAGGTTTFQTGYSAGLGLPDQNLWGARLVVADLDDDGDNWNFTLGRNALSSMQFAPERTSFSPYAVRDNVFDVGNFTGATWHSNHYDPSNGWNHEWEVQAALGVGGEAGDGLRWDQLVGWTSAEFGTETFEMGCPLAGTRFVSNDAVYQQMCSLARTIPAFVSIANDATIGRDDRTQTITDPRELVRILVDGGITIQTQEQAIALARVVRDMTGGDITAYLGLSRTVLGGAPGSTSYLSVNAQASVIGDQTYVGVGAQAQWMPVDGENVRLGVGGAAEFGQFDNYAQVGESGTAWSARGGFVAEVGARDTEEGFYARGFAGYEAGDRPAPFAGLTLTPAAREAFDRDGFVASAEAGFRNRNGVSISGRYGREGDEDRFTLRAALAF